MSESERSALASCSTDWLEQLDLAQLDPFDLELLEQELSSRVNEIYARDQAEQEREDLKCAEDALYWAQTWTATENPKYLEQGLPFRSPFPRKSYFAPLFKEFYQCKRLLIPKSREMITSWSVMAYAANRAQYSRAEVVVQTDSEAKAKELVGYASCLYRNQPDWLKQLNPLTRDPSQTEIEYKSGGRLFGIPKGVHKIRMFHPTLVVFDEAAFLPEFQECYNTAHPVAGQIIAISSAGPGAFADLCES